MKYKLIVQRSFAIQVMADMDEKCKVITQDEKWVTLEIEINDGVDLLRLFGSGINYQLNLTKKLFDY